MVRVASLFSQILQKIGSGSVCLSRGIQEPDHVGDRPPAGLDAGRHGRGHAPPERLMRAAKVVVHEVQGDRRGEVFHLLGKRVGQPGQAPHAHTHSEVLALDIAGRDVGGIGRALDRGLLASQALGRAVADLRPLRRRPVDLDQLGVVHLAAESGLDGLEVHPVSVRGELDAARQAAGEILAQLGRGPRVAEPDQERRHQLRVRIDRDESPHVAVAEDAPILGTDVLRLGVAEAPDFVNLEASTGKVPKHAVLVGGARVAKLDQELQDGVLRHARHAHRAVDGVALDQGGDDRDSLLGLQDVCHTDHYACTGKRCQGGR
jgi:hypothetical protein